MHLIAILENGTPAEDLGELPPVAQVVCGSAAELYRRVGFTDPWIAYLAFEDGMCVGTCAFKSPPVDSRVEMAYYTFPTHEGKGIATRMARMLIDLARVSRPSLIVAAQTLPGESASTTVLKRLGLRKMGELLHPEDGQVWEWQLPPVVVRPAPTYLAGMSAALPPRSAPSPERPRMIGELARAFQQRAGEIPNRIGSERYSVIENDVRESGATPTVWVMIPVESFDRLPEWCECLILPPGRYAVFAHRGLPREISKTVGLVLSTWSSHLPELYESEREIFIYPAGYDPTDPGGTFEYWLPL